MDTSQSVELSYSALTELDKVAEEIIAFAGTTKVWALEGEMGAGKTTLIKAICNLYEIEDNVSSPTFSIVNQYRSKEGNTFYHFDFYRIKDEEEALDIGVEEYFYSGDRCFLEWPSKIESLLPTDLVTINIQVHENSRTITLFKNIISV